MFNRKKKEEISATELKLTRMFEEMNGENSGADSEKLICETQCTMARIRSYSDFLYIMRVKPIQTLCYYSAAVMFLLMLAALWCKEFVLTVIFGIFFLLLAALPHNMRIHFFNKQADSLENSFLKIINAEFGENEIILKISEPAEQENKNNEDESSARRSELLTKSAVTITVPYNRIRSAYECSHSFYLFPADENGHKMETIICDKTQFLCGTPMNLRNVLVKNVGKNFRIKIKKA